MISAIRRVLRSRRVAGDDGLSLVELMVVMVILGILTAAVAGIFVTSVKATKSNEIELNQSNDGRVAMETMSRVLETAVLPSSLSACAPDCDGSPTAAFIEGDAFKVSFYADVDNKDNTVGPSQVSFFVDDDNQLVETTQTPDAGSADTGYSWTPCTLGDAGCSLKRRVLAQNVVKTGSGLFSYYLYDQPGTALTSVSLTQLGDVDSVDVTLSIHDPNAGAVGPVTYVSRVTLPNVDTVIVASASPST